MILDEHTEFCDATDRNSLKASDHLAAHVFDLERAHGGRRGELPAKEGHDSPAHVEVRPTAGKVRNERHGLEHEVGKVGARARVVREQRFVDVGDSHDIAPILDSQPREPFEGGDVGFHAAGVAAIGSVLDQNLAQVVYL